MFCESYRCQSRSESAFFGAWQLKKDEEIRQISYQYSLSEFRSEYDNHFNGKFK